jgi:hypothetical protein
MATNAERNLGDGCPGSFGALIRGKHCKGWHRKCYVESVLTREGRETGLYTVSRLFNIYGEYILRRATENWDGGVSIGGRKICNLRYADDTLLASNETTESIKLGLYVNHAKTKLMFVYRARRP